MWIDCGYPMRSYFRAHVFCFFSSSFYISYFSQDPKHLRVQTMQYFLVPTEEWGRGRDMRQAWYTLSRIAGIFHMYVEWIDEHDLCNFQKYVFLIEEASESLTWAGGNFSAVLAFLYAARSDQCWMWAFHSWAIHFWATLSLTSGVLVLKNSTHSRNGIGPPYGVVQLWGSSLVPEQSPLLTVCFPDHGRGIQIFFVCRMRVKKGNPHWTQAFLSLWYRLNPIALVLNFIILDELNLKMDLRTTAPLFSTERRWLCWTF